MLRSQKIFWLVSATYYYIIIVFTWVIVEFEDTTEELEPCDARYVVLWLAIDEEILKQPIDFFVGVTN
jgi:hypothetical protein